MFRIFIIGWFLINASLCLADTAGIKETQTGIYLGTTMFPAAVTATTPSVQATAGTLLTTPVAGSIFEYDGKAFYDTPNASNRGIRIVEHVAVNAASQTGQNVNTAQAWFQGTLTNGAITLPAATTYEFDGSMALSRTAGTTSHTTGILFGGTATLTFIQYDANVYTNNTSLATLSSGQHDWTANATLNTLTAANTSATEQLVIKVRGTLAVNAAGTFIPQFQYSAAPGGAPTIAQGTYFRLRPIGSNTVTNVGNWN